ncbi:MAG: helix-hairpin-helix domain-containing protein [Bacillota bacterium]
MENINVAGVKELQKIKGIGKVTAENIVNYREEIGGFDSLEQVKEVSGIGAKSFANLKELMAVGEADDNLKTEDASPKEGNESENDLVRIELDLTNHDISEIDEAHLVGDMNNWDPTDKTYALEKEEPGIWGAYFDLDEGIEYKIMYDSTSWEEGKHIGYHGGNLTVQK